MNVIFRPLAVEDTVEAAAWYEERAPGLGDELIDEILAAADRARQNPELFRTVHRHGKIRRVLTNRFPYRIFFLSRRRNSLRPRRSPWRATRSPLA